MEKELNIIPPIGYEIDKQKSTFEKIIFSKIEPCKPTTWEEYYEQTKNRTYYTCICCCESHVGETAAYMTRVAETTALAHGVPTTATAKSG